MKRFIVLHVYIYTRRQGIPLDVKKGQTSSITKVQFGGRKKQKKSPYVKSALKTRIDIFLDIRTI
jgi:hypothetical protein